MTQLIRSLITLIAIMLAHPLLAAEPEFETPRVLLTGVAATISVGELPGDTVTFTVNGRTPTSIDRRGLSASAEVELAETGTAILQVLRGGDLIEEHIVPVIPGWVSVLPPLIAILLSFASLM